MASENSSWLNCHYTELEPIAADGRGDMGYRAVDKVFTYYLTAVVYAYGEQDDIKVWAPSTWDRERIQTHLIETYNPSWRDWRHDDDPVEAKPIGPAPSAESTTSTDDSDVTF